MRNDDLTISVSRPSSSSSSSSSSDMVVVVVVTSCRMETLGKYPVMKIFPDNMGREDSLFPSEGVTITSKEQGHLVVAYQHYEKWILAGFSRETVELGTFSEHWKGCSITFCKCESG